MNNAILYNTMYTIIVVLLMVGLGLFVINQTLSYFYKSQFLQTPCELCISLEGNEWMKPCVEEQRTIIRDSTGNIISPEEIKLKEKEYWNNLKINLSELE